MIHELLFRVNIPQRCALHTQGDVSSEVNPMWQEGSRDLVEHVHLVGRI